MDGNQIRQEYLLAREMVAKELIEKYHLIESYRDDEKLTLNSKDYSFHFTFYVPDPPLLYICKKGELPTSKDSYFGHITSMTNTIEAIDELLKKNASKLTKLSESMHEYDHRAILHGFQISLLFFKTEYPQYFN